MKEEFDPTNPSYKTTSDLPDEHKDGFVDVESGFVRKEAAENFASEQEQAREYNQQIPFRDKLLKRNLKDATDVAHEDALKENDRRDEQKKEEEKERMEADQRRKEVEKMAALREAKESAQLEKIDTLIGDDETALAEEIRANLDKPGFIDALAKRFGFEEEGYSANSLVEYALNKVVDLRRRTGKPYTKLINVLGETFLTLESTNRRDFTDWSHTVCHLFEKYNRPRGFSFLREGEHRPIAEKLVNESILRTSKIGAIGCVDRILGPLAQYNIDQMDPDNLEAFAFMPDEEGVDKIIPMLDSKYHQITILFLESTTPRDLLVRFVHERRIPKMDPERMLQLIEAVRNDVPEEEFVRYCQQLNGGRDSSLEELRENAKVAEAASEECKGVFVDVDGTLIQDGALNKNLLSRLLGDKKWYKQIVIFTGGDPEEQTRRLRELGVPEEFLPVQSKDDYKGKVLQKLIDDSPPEYQGFKAESHEQP